MHGQIPLVWERASDFSIFDPAGNKFIDFTSAIFLANVGHANPRVVKAVTDIVQKPLIHAYNYPTDIRARYLEELVVFTGHGMEKAFLLSAGTEATEAAMKLMRLHGLKEGKRRPLIISFKGNYHGRTMGAQMLSSNQQQKEWIGFQDSNVAYLDFPFPWVVDAGEERGFFRGSLDRLIREEGLDLSQDVCGFMLEVFQGWAAAFYPKDFVREIKEVCDKHRILLCFDEVQAGFARTGKAFGYEHYGVEADLLCCGKGIGSGIVLSAVIGRGEIMDLPPVGSMSSTHSANPIACTAGLATLEEIRAKGLIKRAEASGKLLHTGLERLKYEYPEHITYVMGMGMIAALHFKSHLFASQVVERCFRKGLLTVFTGRESIKLGPPLTIPDEALLEGLEVMREAIRETIAL
jgi:4-aminobutyrate aminotransferase and related aminotransferases